MKRKLSITSQFVYWLKSKCSISIKAICITGISIILQNEVFAQKVKSTTIDFKQIAAYQSAHPDWMKPCRSCKEKEADSKDGVNESWKGIDNPNMPITDPSRITKMDIVAGGPTSPLPTGPSFSPSQNWLGHIDPAVTIPPDSHGAVGLNHVVTATNDFIKIHAKMGGAQISQVTISAFTGVTSTCDPYLIFDPTSQRWIFSAISCANVGNVMILMTSNTSDPTGTWRKITWVPSGPTMLLDHPYVGFDNQRIVLSGRRFVGPNLFSLAFGGSSLFLINKAAMYNGTAITFGTNAQQIDKAIADGDAPLPVTVYDPPYSTTGNPSPGTFYILQAWNGTSIRFTTVTGTIPTATWNTGSAVFPTSTLGAWNNGNIGNAATQTVETRKLAVNDARISCGIMMNGSIWACHHVTFPTSGTPTRVAVQWWKLSSAGLVQQNGRVGGSVANEYKWFPSIAVNKFEEVIIGYTASTSTSRVNAAYVTRSATTPINTTDNEFIYKTGLNRYWKDFGSGRARWGDYSHAALDPVDGSLWTIQEYAEAGAGAIPPDNNSRYGVWWAQVKARPDLFIKDDLADNGTEPNPLASGVFWASPDIWVCNGGFNNSCAAHTNPIGSNPNTVRVRVTNRGTANSTGTEVLKVYWAKASTSLDWDNSWKSTGTPLLCGQIRGNLIGSLTLPSTIAPGTSQIFNINWTPPDPSNYSCFPAGFDRSHFCLLARIETANTAPFGMTFPETTDLWSNVKNNNNIAWKNVSITDLNPSGSGIAPPPPPPVPGQQNTTVLIAGEKFSGKKDGTRFDFVVPREEVGANNILNFAKVHIDLGVFLERWKANGSKGAGFVVEQVKVPLYRSPTDYTIVEKTLLRLTDPNAYIDGVVIAPEEISTLGVMVTQTADYSLRIPLHLDVIHKQPGVKPGIIGGENFDFRLLDKAPAQTMPLGQSVISDEDKLDIDFTVESANKLIKAKELSVNNGNYHVEVWDNSGRELLNKVMSGTVVIDGKEWPSGIYTVRIINTVNRKTIVKRIQL